MCKKGFHETVPTRVVRAVHERLHQLLLLLEATEGGDAAKDVVVDRLTKIQTIIPKMNICAGKVSYRFGMMCV